MDFLLYHRSDEKGVILERTLRTFVQTHQGIRLTVSSPTTVPSNLLPCLVIKSESSVLLQLLKAFHMFGGEKMTVVGVEYVLGKYGLIPETVHEDPRGYPYDADELLNFPMSLQVPVVPEVQLEEVTRDNFGDLSIGERIPLLFHRVFDHPIAHRTR